MPTLMAVCDKCGEIVGGDIHVSANGMVSASPGGAPDHWKKSPGCTGHYGIVSIADLAAAQQVMQRMAEEERRKLDEAVADTHALLNELQSLTGCKWVKDIPGLEKWLDPEGFKVLHDGVSDRARGELGLMVRAAREAHSTGVWRGSQSMKRSYDAALRLADGESMAPVGPYQVTCPGCSKDLGLTQAGPNRSQVIDPDVIAAHYAESPACGQIVYLGANRAPDPEGRPGA